MLEYKDKNEWGKNKWGNKIMDISELDGTYQVSTVSDYNGPIEKRSDGLTEIIEGKTHRTDDAGVIWTTQISVLNADEVEFVSTADPTNADPDFCLMDEGGNLTRESVTYTSVLKIDRKGDKIRPSGQIKHGSTNTVITMIKKP